MNRHTIVIYLPSRGVERQRRGHARHSKGVAQAALATAPVPGRPSAAVLVTAVAASAIGSALGGEGWRRAGGGGGRYIGCRRCRRRWPGMPQRHRWPAFWVRKYKTCAHPLSLGPVGDSNLNRYFPPSGIE